MNPNISQYGILTESETDPNTLESLTREVFSRDPEVETPQVLLVDLKQVRPFVSRTLHNPSEVISSRLAED
ncbi:MAG: hypothetical protein ABF370_10870 [Verrucomicrobiales bacterium]